MPPYIYFDYSPLLVRFAWLACRTQGVTWRKKFEWIQNHSDFRKRRLLLLDVETWASQKQKSAILNHSILPFAKIVTQWSLVHWPNSNPIFRFMLLDFLKIRFDALSMCIHFIHISVENRKLTHWQLFEINNLYVSKEPILSKNRSSLIHLEYWRTLGNKIKLGTVCDIFFWIEQLH